MRKARRWMVAAAGTFASLALVSVVQGERPDGQKPDGDTPGGTDQVMAPRPFDFDFGDFRVGTAEYPEGPTGCTVLYFPEGAIAAVDIRGGAAAVRESSAADPINSFGWLDAIVLAGGSTYGLEAADGVMEKLRELREGKTDFDSIPAVAAAVVYDYAGRENNLFPDKALGARAFEAARSGTVLVGPAGGGANVSVGKYFGRKYAERSGQGAAYFAFPNGVKLFAISVVNAVGNVLGRDGRIAAGSLDRATGERFSIADRLMAPGGRAALDASVSPPKGNTTISAVVTNVQIDRLSLQRLAIMAHTAMGRVIDPFHGPSDGDVLFVATTRSLEAPKDLDVSDIGTVSGRLLQDSVLRSVGALPF